VAVAAFDHPKLFRNHRFVIKLASLSVEVDSFNGEEVEADIAFVCNNLAGPNGRFFKLNFEVVFINHPKGENAILNLGFGLMLNRFILHFILELFVDVHGNSN
jgi:hypothetical protein